MKFIYTVKPTLVTRRLGSSLKLNADGEDTQYVCGTPQFKVLYDPDLGIIVETEIEHVPVVAEFFREHRLPLKYKKNKLLSTETSVKEEVLALQEIGFILENSIWKYNPKSSEIIGSSVKP